jgi:lysophospholipase L1-like esterase
MPLGDSITEGYDSSPPGGGYRVELFRQTVTNSQLVTFVGSLMNGPDTVSGKTFPKSHEGHDGYTIDDGSGHSGIYPLVAQSLTNNRPNIVLLMIGTNDVNGNVDLANAPTRLGLLLDRITSTSPDALVVVAKIVPTMTDGTNTRVGTYNDAIPGLLAQRTAMGKHIVVIDMYSAFTSNTNYKTAWMADNLHPNDAGYVILGQTWYAAIRDLLPATQ